MTLVAPLVDEAALDREERAACAAWVEAIRAHLHAEPDALAVHRAVRTASTPPANDQHHDTEPTPAPRDTEPTPTLPASGVQARSVMIPPPPAPARSPAT